MSEVFEIRRVNLLGLSKLYESQMAFARAAELNGGQLRQLLNLTDAGKGPPRRTCGEKLARKLEQTLGLHAGWLDTPRLHPTPRKESSMTYDDFFEKSRAIREELQRIADRTAQIARARLGNAENDELQKLMGRHKELTDKHSQIEQEVIKANGLNI